MDTFVNNDTPQEGATFGEYRTSTKIDGVQSQFMPQVDALEDRKISSFGGVQGSSDFKQTTTTTTTTKYTTSSSSGGESQVSYNKAIQTSTKVAPTKTLPVKFLPPIFGKSDSSNFQATTTTTTSTNNFGGMDTQLSGQATEGATFGEYRTSTKIDGVQSQYMPQVDALEDKGLATVDTGASLGDFQMTTTTTSTTNFGGMDTQLISQATEGATFGEYRTSTKIDGVQSQYMPQVDALEDKGLTTVDTGANVTDFQTTTTTETTTTGFDLNQLGTTSSGFDASTFQTTEPVVDTVANLTDFQTTMTTTTSATNFGGIDTQLSGQATEGATFGEYRTSTKIDGVQSQYMPQVDALEDKGSATVDTGASSFQTTTKTTTSNTNFGGIDTQLSGQTTEGATFGEYRTSTKIDGVQSQYMPQIDAISTDLPSIPAVPTRTLNQVSLGANAFGTVQTGEEVATVTPLKGSFAVSRNKYIGGMSTINQGNAYNTSTYNVGQAGTTSYSKYTTVTKNYNTRTYNHKA